MQIISKHIGKSTHKPAKIIELIFDADSTKFTVDVTTLSGLVDVSLIYNLRQIADELEEQNNLINQGE
jgi:hypothetical protein